jgi:ribosomal protein S18 acetylase RimI-like enzyme
MNLHIRQATPDDLPQVLALYAQPDMDDGEVLSLPEAVAIFEQFQRYPNYRLFVACEGGEQGPVLGTYALLIMHMLAHLGTPAAVVEDVVVDQAQRSQGVGALMMDHAKALAQEAGCYKLALSSNQKRERAHAFYESLGFERHGYSFLIEI